MKKPINKFALMLWALAVLVVIGGAGEYAAILASARELTTRDGHTYLVGGFVWKLLMSGLLPAAQLAGFGMIIELVDQIRWNALRRQK